jgi:hypothetical protein
MEKREFEVIVCAELGGLFLASWMRLIRIATQAERKLSATAHGCSRKPCAVAESLQTLNAWPVLIPAQLFAFFNGKWVNRWVCTSKPDCHSCSPCAFGWLAHSRNIRLRLFIEDTRTT